MLLVWSCALVVSTLVACVVLRSRKTTPPAAAVARPADDPPGHAPTEALARGNAIPSLEQPAEEEEDASTSQTSMVAVAYEEDAEISEVTARFARIALSARGESDRGHVRARNEDSMLILPAHSLYAIADGMGGHAGGEVASALALDALRDSFEHQVCQGDLECDEPLPIAARELACGIQIANQTVRAYARTDRRLSNMGTTVVAARFAPNKQRLYIAHVGDSRCYVLRRNTLRQLTRDHTLRMLGLSGPESDRLFQALGVTPKILIDVVVEKPRPGDRYLLCTDGLSKMVSDEQIRDVLLLESDVDAAAATLVELAKDLGGRDNVTVVLVQVTGREGRANVDVTTQATT